MAKTPKPKHKKKTAKRKTPRKTKGIKKKRSKKIKATAASLLVPDAVTVASPAAVVAKEKENVTLDLKEVKKTRDKTKVGKKKRSKKVKAAVASLQILDAAAAPATPAAPATGDAPAAAAAEEKENVTFTSLGLKEVLCESCEVLKWIHPTPIQRDAIPPALTGKDIIGVAETGSGKTGAFVLPILHRLLENPQRLFALILAPVRELVIQIADTIDALGASIDVKCLTIVGGVDSMTQSIALARKPHVICATPGRLVDHLENTKGFNLRSIKYLVLDEADRMLSMDFEEELNQILEVIPTERTTMLFSATMTSKVAKLERAALRNPIKVEVSNKYQTVKTLIQNYLFIPEKYKDCYLVYILNEFAGQTMLVFMKTCNECERVTLMLRSLGFNATCLHGRMQQAARLGALNKFKAGARNILAATDVASRGLDIPTVDMVLNFSIPSNSKDYVHRVGRTARAGRAGRALNFVTQYDVQDYQRIEKDLKKRLELFKVDEEVVLVLLERVLEAQRFAAVKLREANKKKSDKRGGKQRNRRR